MSDSRTAEAMSDGPYNTKEESVKLHILNLKIAIGAKLMRWGLWGRNAPPERWVKWHGDLCALARRSTSGDEAA